MTEEIKEIFYKLKSDDYYEEHYQQSVYYERDLIKLENYITNLQQEIKEANDSVTWWTNRFNALRKENERLRTELNGYKSRNKKAIEYIKNNLTISSILDGKTSYCLNDYSFDYNDLLNILQGGDED